MNLFPTYWLALFFLINPPSFSGSGFHSKEISEFGMVKEDCKFNDIPLYGKVKFVKSFGDIKIKFVESFPDIKVKFVSSFPNQCGKWQIVESFPDFTVEVVESFPDLKIKSVESFPGMN